MARGAKPMIQERARGPEKPTDEERATESEKPKRRERAKFDEKPTDDESKPVEKRNPEPKSEYRDTVRKGQRGGRRAGAGRKVSVQGGRKQLTINLNASTVATLAARKIEQIVEQYIANQKP
jgi:hypothetical protein